MVRDRAGAQARGDVLVARPAPPHGLKGAPSNNRMGRPPVDFRVAGTTLLDRIDAGTSMRQAAIMAGVSQRTLNRAFFEAGWVVALRRRDPVYMPDLPRPRCHFLPDLLAARDRFAEADNYGGVEQFSRAVGLSPRSQFKVWAQLDELNRARARGERVQFRDLPGSSPTAHRGVDPEREVAPPTPRGAPRYSVSRQQHLRLTRDQVDARYSRGETIADLARDANCSPTTLLRRMEQWGIERRGRGPAAGAAASKPYTEATGGVPFP